MDLQSMRNISKMTKVTNPVSQKIQSIFTLLSGCQRTEIELSSVGIVA